MKYSRVWWNHIRLFARSIGVYFSLQAYKDKPVKQFLSLSPIVDMERIIQNLMIWLHISKSKFKTEIEITTSIGHTLIWTAIVM